MSIDIPQDPGQAGKSQKAYLGGKFPGFNVRFSPESGEKETRALGLSAQAEAGNVFLVRGPWNKPFIDEAALFPNSTFKDQIDAASRAFNRLIVRQTAGRERAGDGVVPMIASVTSPPLRTCSVEGCGRKHEAKNLCDRHYKRLMKGAPLDTAIRQTSNGKICSVEGCGRKYFSNDMCYSHYAAGRICSVEGCERRHVAKNLCDTHYSRARNGISLEKPIRGPALPKGTLCIVQGCGRDYAVKNMCAYHYRLFRIEKSEDAGIICSHPGCERSSRSKHMGGLCVTHFWRRKHGSRMDNTCKDCGQTIAIPRETNRRKLRHYCDQCLTSPCKHPGCSSSRWALGFCNLHYTRFRAGREMDEPKTGTITVCTIEGCSRKLIARGMCNMHYSRWKMGETGAKLDGAIPVRSADREVLST